MILGYPSLTDKFVLLRTCPSRSARVGGSFIGTSALPDFLYDTEVRSTLSSALGMLASVRAVCVNLPNFWNFQKFNIIVLQFRTIVLRSEKLHPTIPCSFLSGSRFKLAERKSEKFFNSPHRHAKNVGLAALNCFCSVIVFVLLFASCYEEHRP